MRRHENRSTMMTSNRPIEEWGKLLTDVPAASAVLDRLLHHAEIIPINGRSYRLQPKTKTHRCPRALRILQFKSKSGINGTSLRAALHLFRFGLEPENAPRDGSDCILHLIAYRSCLAPSIKRKNTRPIRHYLPTIFNPSNNHKNG